MVLRGKCILREAVWSVILSDPLKSTQLVSDRTQTRALFASPLSAPQPRPTMSSSPAAECLRTHCEPGPQICPGSVQRTKHALYFCSDGFRKSPFSFLWQKHYLHLFHIEMKLFSETNPFQPHSFTLICGSWQEINSHFLCSFWLKDSIVEDLYFVVVVVGLLMQFVDQCPRIDVFTEERKWYFCVSSTQTRPWACVRDCLKVTFRAGTEQGSRCAQYCWRGFCFLAFQRTELGNTCSSTHRQTYKYIHKHLCLCVYDFVTFCLVLHSSHPYWFKFEHVGSYKRCHTVLYPHHSILFHPYR